MSGFFEVGAVTMILGVSRLCTRWLF